MSDANDPRRTPEKSEDSGRSGPAPRRSRRRVLIWIAVPVLVGLVATGVIIQSFFTGARDPDAAPSDWPAAPATSTPGNGRGEQPERDSARTVDLRSQPGPRSAPFTNPQLLTSLLPSETAEYTMTSMLPTGASTIIVCWGTPESAGISMQRLDLETGEALWEAPGVNCGNIVLSGDGKSVVLVRNEDPGEYTQRTGLYGFDVETGAELGTAIIDGRFFPYENTRGVISARPKQFAAAGPLPSSLDDSVVLYSADTIRRYDPRSLDKPRWSWTATSADAPVSEADETPRFAVSDSHVFVGDALVSLADGSSRRFDTLQRDATYTLAAPGMLVEKTVPGEGKTSVRLLRADSGKTVWAHTFGGNSTRLEYVDDRYVRITRASSDISYLDAHTGKLLREGTRDETREPLFADREITVTVDPTQNMAPLVLDTATGNKRFALPAPTDSTPTWRVAGRSTDTLYLFEAREGSRPSRLFGVDLASGRTLWEHAVPGSDVQYYAVGNQLVGVDFLQFGLTGARSLYGLGEAG